MKQEQKILAMKKHVFLALMLLFSLMLQVDAQTTNVPLDCRGAFTICNYVTRVPAPFPYKGKGQVTNEITGTCLSSGEFDGIFYKITPKCNGVLKFLIIPDMPIDYDYVVYDMTGLECGVQMPARKVISCNYSAQYSTTGTIDASTQTNQSAAGSPYNKPINVVQNGVYYLYINKFSVGLDVGFTLDFTGTTSCVLDGSFDAEITTIPSEVCKDKEFQLSAATTSAHPENVSYIWAPANLILSQIGNTATVKLNSDATFTVFAREKNGCDANATINVEVQEVCNTCSPAPRWQWKTGENWFFGDALFANFANGTGNIDITSLPNINQRIGYEGTSTVSDNEGNLLYFSNGIKLWNAANVEKTDALLTGREKYQLDGTGQPTVQSEGSSALQGVLFVKHPSDNDKVYIFTVDDALTTDDNVKGLNYFVLTLSSGNVSGPTRLGSYRTTEQLDATYHSNGTDIWITTRQSGRDNKADFQNIYTYLLTSTGVNSTPVVSSVAPSVEAAVFSTNSDRGALRFSWDGEHAAMSNQMGDFEDKNDAIVIYDFNDATGVFSNAKSVAATWGTSNWVGDVYGSAYDCEFTPNSNGLYVTFVGSNKIILIEDITLSTASAIHDADNITVLSETDAAQSCDIKLGGDGNLYQTTFGNALNVFSFTNINTGAGYSKSTITLPEGRSSGRAFSNMFIGVKVAPTITVIPAAPSVCLGESVQLAASGALNYTWSPSAGLSAIDISNPIAFPQSTTTYIVTGTDANGCVGTADITVSVNSAGCDEVFCEECIPSFSPVPGQKYVISAWVKESVLDVATYDNAAIVLEFKLSSSNTATIIGPFKGKGAIIDGWQRIEYEFIIPSDAVDITVHLKNIGAGQVYFDDIRIHPFNANMKSFVYDPTTLRLHAEMDENNYATYYEYDEEGALVRVKKETERGIKTINETRQNLSKQK